MSDLQPREDKEKLEYPVNPWSISNIVLAKRKVFSLTYHSVIITWLQCVLLWYVVCPPGSIFPTKTKKTFTLWICISPVGLKTVSKVGNKTWQLIATARCFFNSSADIWISRSNLEFIWLFLHWAVARLLAVATLLTLSCQQQWQSKYHGEMLGGREPLKNSEMGLLGFKRVKSLFQFVELELAWTQKT